jgi:hypothetical protein
MIGIGLAVGINTEKPTLVNVWWGCVAALVIAVRTLQNTGARCIVFGR